MHRGLTTWIFPRMQAVMGIMSSIRDDYLPLQMMDDEDTLDDYSELTGDVPELIRGNELDLADLGGPDRRAEHRADPDVARQAGVRAGAARDPAGRRGRTDIAAFTGIGGHLDPGERWTEAVTRARRWKRRASRLRWATAR